MNVDWIDYNDISRRMDIHLRNEGSPGRQTGFSCLNEFYTHKQGGVTDWTGLPASGKTYYVLETLFGECEEYGKRFGLYLPDLGSEEDIFEKLIKMHCGKDFHNKYHNKATEADIIKSLSWISRHFLILKRKDFKKGITPEEIWEFTCEHKDDYGVLDGILVDSWKNMKHLYSGREDQYLDEVLSVRNEYAEKYNKHFHTIAHAVKMENSEKNGRRIPNAYDIKGGGAWSANGKNIITIDFPDKSSFGVNVYVSKVKPESVGKVGQIVDKIFLDPAKGRYYEKINDKRCYSFDWKKENLYNSQSNIDFNNPPKYEPSPF